MIEQLLQADRLLAVDMVEGAESIYRRVSEQDPRDAIAVVGLARCALARGDEPGAHRLAVRALGIDPENDMALRMERRLAEILALRGEAVTRPPMATSASAEALRPMVAGAVERPGGDGPPAGADPSLSGDTPAGGAAGPTGARRRGLLERFLGR
jgi:hypothetical protein